MRRGSCAYFGGGGPEVGVLRDWLPASSMSRQGWIPSLQNVRCLPSGVGQFKAVEVGDRFLPKPSVERFEGDPMNYWAFVNRFEVHVASRITDDDLRLAYVLQHCAKPVYEKLKHIASDKNKSRAYRKVWKELYERYGQPHVISRCCERRLIEFPKEAFSDADWLEDLAVLLKRCLASLEEVQSPTTVDSPTFVASIAEKLPLELKREWVSCALTIQRQKGELAGFEEFAEFVMEQSVKANSVYCKLLFPKTTQRGDASTNRARARTSKVLTSVTTVPTGSKEVKHVFKESCLCCRRAHKLEDCPEFRQMTLKERKLLVRSKRLCFKCLSQGYMAVDCNVSGTCGIAGCTDTNHHTFLHVNQRRPGAVNSGELSPPEAAECLHLVVPSKQTPKSPAYLDIIPLRVLKNNKEVLTYALLDSGANKTFCERSLLESLGVTDAEPVIFNISTLASKCPSKVDTVSTSLTILPLNNQDAMDLPDVVMTEAIPASPNKVPDSCLLDSLDYLKGVSLDEVEGGTVSLLIGNDNILAHRCLECRFSPDPARLPDAVRTPLGWLLKGPALSEVAGSNASFFTNSCHSMDSLLAKELLVNDRGEFWSRDQVENTDLVDMENLLTWLQSHKEASEFGMKYSGEDVMAYDFMERNIEFVDGHYQMPLPWKNNAVKLPESRAMATRRLQHLKRRLEKNPDLHQKYTEQMEAYIKKGYAKVVQDKEASAKRRMWYLPHHAVINEKKPGKVRIVFDCAARLCGQSFNDHLMKGPNLVNSIVGVLLRFRKHLIAVVGDIESMFHQVRVSPEDCDSLRFLWWPQGNLLAEPVAHRMVVHLFGAKPAPSIATFCLKETAKEFGKFFEPHIAQNVKRCFYVDDFLSGAGNVELAAKLTKDMQQIMTMAGFNLSKWLSTNEKVLDTIPEERRGKGMKEILLGSSGQSSVLGIKWSLAKDAFYFIVDVPDKHLTKRTLLSVTNSLYDPLGFLAPVVLEARVLYRHVCQEKQDWDKPCTSSVGRQWKCWCGSLNDLRDICIPRCYMSEGKMLGMQLHFFCDVSSYARGCVCYMRITREDGGIDCNILTGKFLLADDGKRTIPQLELEAALDTVRLARVVKRELDLEDCMTTFWSDSSAVLLSLQADCKQFSVFFRNRLAQIQRHSSIPDWRYVPSELNPADQASRGATASELLKKGTWLTGPEFLRLKPERWPRGLPENEVQANICQIFDSSVESKVPTDNVDAVDKLIDYFSNLYRLKLATCWMLRFVNYWKEKTCTTRGIEIHTGPISVEELEMAEIALVKYVQATHYSDWINHLQGQSNKRLIKSSPLWKLNPILVEGLMRVGGRLGNASFSFDTKHPVILSKNLSLTQLIIDHFHCHNVAHSGVNTTLNALQQRFWIENGRVTPPRVLAKCLFCIRRSARPAEQLMAELPPARLQNGEPPFSHTGSDCFGPFIVKHKRSEL